MQQNLQNSVAYGEAARQYRDWSQKNWQQVTGARSASQDRRNFTVRENLGGVQTFANPYGTPPVELPMTHKYYWTDGQGLLSGWTIRAPTQTPARPVNGARWSGWRGSVTQRIAPQAVVAAQQQRIGGVGVHEFGRLIALMSGCRRAPVATISDTATGPAARHRSSGRSLSKACTCYSWCYLAA